MADTILKTKVQLRSINVTTNGGVNLNGGDKTPTTPSKLMINHGKPNFTIQRSPKVQNGDENPLAHELNKNNNYNPYKKAESRIVTNSNNVLITSTKFNGAFKPSNISMAPKQPHQNSENNEDNEATKVVLRRPKTAEPTDVKNDEDDAVPEFIRRQRRIQERLAKENVLDFENRRSGYFTHVVISPSSPSRKSFVETMSSPAIVPALEMPPPTPTTPPPSMASVEELSEETQHGEQTETIEKHIECRAEEVQDHVESVVTTNGHTNGYHGEEPEEEEVAKAIEEVNKAVAGEDCDKLSDVKEDEVQSTHDEHIDEPKVDADATVTETATTWEVIEPPTEFKSAEPESVPVTNVAVATTAHIETESESKTKSVEHHSDAAATDEPVAQQQNGHVEVVEVHQAPMENGHADVTISHTNGFDSPHVPAPDPSGALGVNYEPKTVVSFSKDLSSEINNYPDTVKVITENGTKVDEELKETAKLKFDIKTEGQEVTVTPTIRTE